jgi:electron transport complex protein RnfD
MWLISLAAFLAVIQSSLTDSFSSLIIAASAVIAAFLAEFMIYFRTEKAGMIKDGSSIASALILTLLLPNHINPVYAAIGAVFAMIVVKYSFGGLGANWVNPAVGGWLFLRFSWPGFFEQTAGAVSPVSSGFIEDHISAFLNKNIFSPFGAELPDGCLTFFNAAGAGIIADRGVFALLIGTIIIMSAQVCRVWVPVVYLGVFGLLTRLFGEMPLGGELGGGNVLGGFLSGGTLVAAFFLAVEPVTGAKSTRGALVAASIAGVFAFLFRYLGNELYGAFFAAALVNAFAPLIRGVESARLYVERRLER